MCALCGAALMLGPRGYTHADGPDKHVPRPVSSRTLALGTGMRYDHVSSGHKRPSGEGALFTRGDGR